MKKIILLSAVFAALVLTGCTKKTVQSQDKIVLKVADIHTEGYPTVVGLHEFSRLVADRSKGRIVIEVIPDGKEGDESSILEKVQFGKLAFARVSISPLSAFDPVFETIVVPGQYRNEIHFWKVMDGPIGQKCLDSLSKYGFYGLCYYDSGARSFYTSKKITSYKDLKGLRIRTQQSAMMLEFMNALGAIPVPLDLKEIGPAIQRNQIDGAENNIPSYETTGQYKDAPYYYSDEHTRIADILVGSKKRLDLLSKEDLELIYECARDSEAVQRLAWKEYEETAIEKVTKEGSVFTAPDLAERSAVLKEIQPVLYKRFSEDQMKMLEEIEALK